MAATGIVVGAAGFCLSGANGRGLLLLHGSGDTPQSVRPLADHLHAAGYTILAPLLPGHGRSPRAFAAATAGEYREATRRALAQLRDLTSWVGVIGLSMGGALACEVTSEAPDVQVLVLLAPYLIPPTNIRWAASTSWLWSPIAPYPHAGGAASVHDVVARDASRAYGTFSRGALKALLDIADAGRKALPRLAVPVLVINSEQDNRIPRVNAIQAVSELRTSVEQHWVTGCGHVITVDLCKDVVAEMVLTFLARHAD